MLTRVIPADGRSRALHRRPHGHGVGRGRALHRPDRPPRPARPPVPAGHRCAAGGARPVRRHRPRAAPGGRRGAQARSAAALAELGGDAGARAREADLLRFQVQRDRGRRPGGSRRGRRPRRRSRTCWPTPPPTARRPPTPSRRCRPRRAPSTPSATAVAAVDGRGPFEALDQRLRAAQAELSDLAAELRAAGEEIEDDPGPPRRRPRAPPAAGGAAPQVRHRTPRPGAHRRGRDPGRRDRLPPGRGGSPRRDRRARRPGRGARCRGPRRGGRARRGRGQGRARPGAAAAPPLAEAVEANLRPAGDGRRPGSP